MCVKPWGWKEPGVKQSSLGPWGLEGKEEQEVRVDLEGVEGGDGQSTARSLEVP